MKPWHQSWIEDMLICPERYRRSHETDEQPGTSASALQGTAVHVAVAAALFNLQNDGLFHTPVAIGKDAKVRFTSMVRDDRLDAEDPIPWGEHAIEERAAEVYVMAEALWNRMPLILEQHGEPLFIEHEFYDVPLGPCECAQAVGPGEFFHHKDCPDYHNIRLEGTWDLLTAGHVLIDWKTSARGWPPERENSKLQPLIYALGVEHVTGKWPNAFIYYIVDRQGKIQTRPVSLDKKRLAFLDATLPELERMRREGIYPLNPSSPLCSEAYCPWFLRGCPAKELKGAA